MVNNLNLGFDPNVYFSQNNPSKEFVQDLHEWIKTQDNVPKTLTDSQLVEFSLANFCNKENTRKCILAYYKSRQFKTLFDNRKMLNGYLSDFKQLNSVAYAVSPGETDEGYRIITFILTNTNPKDLHLALEFKILFMCFDAILYKNPPKGFIFIIDQTGCSLAFITQFRFGILKQAFQYIQEGLPINIHSIHVINTAKSINAIMSLVYPCVDIALLKKLTFHCSNTNMKEFGEKFVPLKYLPSDYGGDPPSIKELHLAQCKLLEEITPYFDAEEKQRRLIDNDFINAIN